MVHIQGSIPDFATRNMDFLFSQTNADLLTALEEFEVRLINYEHMLRKKHFYPLHCTVEKLFKFLILIILIFFYSTRRRSLKQKRITGSQNKIVKLLDVVPEVIFGSGPSGTRPSAL